MLLKIGDSKGQSIIETLVAVAIIVVGLVGILALVVNALAAGKISKETVIGTNLAREGIEVVRSVRDTNWFAKKSFDEGILGGGEVRYLKPTFNPNKNDWELISGSSTDLFSDEYKLYFKDYYNYSKAGTDSGFWRVIIARRNLVDPNQLEITAKVGWMEKGKEKQIILSDYLTDWLTEKSVE